MERTSPTDIKGTFAKVYFVAQTGVEPPTITMVVNYPDLFRPGYLRFLMNRFREELPFSEVPIRLVVRARRQREDDLAADGTQPARVARGRKGVRERLKHGDSRPAAGAQEFGEEMLNDINSEPVDIDVFSGDPDDYFDSSDDETKAKPKLKRMTRK